MNGRDKGPAPAGDPTAKEGQSPPPAKLPSWRGQPVAEEAPVLTVDGELMRDLASRAIAAGSNGMTKVGVAAVRHGEGATTIARSLAACLTANFGQRVVLVEANQRSPSLREVCGLPPGAGLADVLSGGASLEAALRMSRSAGKMLVLPASLSPMGNPAAHLPGPLRNLIAELFFYADALVFDLPPLLPYPDALAIGTVLDGLAVVMRAGQATRKDCSKALAGLQTAGITVLGAVLNREKPVIPGFIARRP
jgi:Mrp family chromosome partitioning ATPase